MEITSKQPLGLSQFFKIFSFLAESSFVIQLELGLDLGLGFGCVIGWNQPTGMGKGVNVVFSLNYWVPKN